MLEKLAIRDVRSRFLDFFKERGHAEIPSASLVPENDPTTLFTGSGMQPLVPYLLGQPHPAGKRIVDVQKSFRAEDIDEVGDNRHTTFFEMLGNWSFGDYFKEDQLAWLFSFLTDAQKGAGLDPAKLYVTVFAGDPETGISADTESIEIWKKLFASKNISDVKYVELGSEKQGSEKGMQGGRIFSYDIKKNWWSRAGIPSKMPTGEPGGPDSEVFYDFGTPHDPKFGAECHPNCDCGRFLEIGNSVFMEYKKKADGTFEKLAQRNVDFGGGLERITAAANNDPDIFSLDIFVETRETLEISTNKSYGNYKEEFRIILDHMRAAVFLLADGVRPSNTGRGYVLRRLIRRAVRVAEKLHGKDITVTNATKDFILHRTLLTDVAETFLKIYDSAYRLIAFANDIIPEIEKEEERFKKTLGQGIKEFEKISANGNIMGQDAFTLFTTYGFPFELTLELAKEQGLRVDTKGFALQMKSHQYLSRTASAGTFKGGLADTSEKTVRLHTAHHLLLKALQTVLGFSVKQRGSNITSERLRLDFSYDGKMTDEQKKEAEKIVNEKIAEDLPVIRSEMARDDAEKLGADHEFGQKYPDRVSVYSIGPKSATIENPQFEKAFSIEFCGGPHVLHTGEIGHFKIVKEEASGAGVRRIRAIID